MGKLAKTRIELEEMILRALRRSDLPHSNCVVRVRPYKDRYTDITWSVVSLDPDDESNMRWPTALHVIIPPMQADYDLVDEPNHLSRGRLDATALSTP
jgi:hypothetical protein